MLPVLPSDSSKEFCNNRRETRLHSPHPSLRGITGKEKEETEMGGGGVGWGGGFFLQAPLSQRERNLDTNFITSQRHTQAGTSDF